ncbi:MAG: DUF4352 domain-containing protein [Pyrinomonadaceae bacterium]
MNTNVNLEAALGVLAFLGSGCLAFLTVLVILHAAIVRKPVRAGLGVLLIAGGAILYFLILLAFSLGSSEKALARGEEKHFCEIDCHLAYSVIDVKKSRTLGDGQNQATAKGIFYMLTVKTRFDEKTISQGRGNQTLTPNPRAATLFDEQGRKYFPSAEGERSLSVSNNLGTPFDTPLRPGEAYATTLVFDVPAGVKSATLLLNESDWVTRFIIGHENSPLHKKTFFRVDAPEALVEKIADFRSAVNTN